jgi:hypothetical protein
MGGLPKEGPKRGQRRGGRQTARSGAVARVPEEYFSIRHPGYRKAESQFVGFNYSYAPAGLDLDELDRLDERLRDDCEADRAVFDAVNMLGVDVLPYSQERRPDDPYDVAAAFLLQVDEISRLIWEHVERWYQNARYAPAPKERACAAKLLRHLGRTLAGSRRGLRAKTAMHPFQVFLYYRRTLFRLEQARRLLKVWPWARSRSRQEKIAAACEACGIPVEEFSLYLNVDSSGQPLGSWRKPKPTAKFARWLTAKEFGITPATVANILSSGSRSRK